MGPVVLTARLRFRERILLHPMLRAPIEKRINDDRHQIGSRDRCNARLLHELVVASKRLISVRTEIDLLAVQLDVPEPAILTKERLRKMRPDKPPL